jgi:hypothetical protein
MGPSNALIRDENAIDRNSIVPVGHTMMGVDAVARPSLFEAHRCEAELPLSREVRMDAETIAQFCKVPVKRFLRGVRMN